MSFNVFSDFNVPCLRRQQKSFPVTADLEKDEWKDEVLVGRIRDDATAPNTINLWCVSDNLRKGAATNAIQIAEKMLERGLI